MLALPGSAYVYQGEELGLPEVLDLPDDVREDPVWHRSGGADIGRDGCRVPMPWSGERAPFGFSDGERSWLPMPADWASFTAQAQTADRSSTLSLYRAALALRRTGFTGDMQWLPSPDHVLDFRRSDGSRCVINLGSTPYPLDATPRLESDALEGSALPPDTAAWL
jgi:alpha-glucosidase